jgi:hypothetical protein
MVLEVPIGTRSTNWYLKYQLVYEVPIGTGSLKKDEKSLKIGQVLPILANF